MNGNAERRPKEPALRAQLTELNRRSHRYSGRLWQIPFAYLAIVVLLLTSNSKTSDMFSELVIGAGLIGLLAAAHMLTGLRDGVQRAVEGIKRVEGELHLKPTAEWKPFSYLDLLIFATAAVAIALLGYGLSSVKGVTVTFEAVGLACDFVGVILLGAAWWGRISPEGGTTYGVLEGTTWRTWFHHAGWGLIVIGFGAQLVGAI